MNKDQLTRKELIEKYHTLSPFEIKDELIKLATKSERKGVRVLLNAGRGNPNWTASTPRQAFFTLGHFAVLETKRMWNDGDLAGMPEQPGIYERFKIFYAENKEAGGIDLLSRIIDYGVEQHGFEPDSWLFELVDGIIGDNYPVPDRMLVKIEKVVREYVLQEMGGNPKDNSYDLFAVEGGTAAMCYIFDSLMANRLMKKGEKLALMVPIFTPYLDIPRLPRYEFEVVPIHASAISGNGRHTWQYPKEELDKLSDPSVKAVCVVNPSNPPSVAMDEDTLAYFKKIVEEKNPNLMIVTDDVYGTFADDFKSLLISLPYNTLGVYSFSKYFGVTGWRLGVIALAQDNVYNKLIANLPQEAKDRLKERYESLTTTPEGLSFIDRLVADSRHVALNHTAGLSTPQQVQMAIFSIFALLDKENSYKQQTKEICRERKKILYDHLVELTMIPNKHSTSYYNEFDLLIWAKMKYGEEFVTYLKEERSAIEFLFDLAEKYSIVLLNGSGFEGPSWSIRVSLANLKNEQYAKIGKAINELFEQYSSDWKNNKVE
ncbi:aspartate 4-decarboxylase [Bacillus sp. AGMB 02131]|uniref:Aminotransferase n=1 Tax=Peribacillus faecalis TaxID=2772559 RepID=A0A927CV12_9BACI|nr:aspartate 4-decarboxylase [Peribacillus faecalis]MBD3108332.1 aspartate 4-decarboxylase [Peribacillus faecalis]